MVEMNSHDASDGQDEEEEEDETTQFYIESMIYHRQVHIFVIYVNQSIILAV